MTKSAKIELVTRYINGETPEELADAFETTVPVVRHTLTHIYKPRRSGRKINVNECEFPALARWLNENGYSGAWLAMRLGVSKQMVHNYLHGYSKIVPRRRRQICAITGLSEEQVFERWKEA